MSTEGPMANGVPQDFGGDIFCTCSDTESTRNLVVCIDGTSNKFGFTVTNVIKLYRLVKKGEGDKQLTWYNSGIGTYAHPSWKSFRYQKQRFYHAIDKAIAWNFETIVLDAYHWLSDNYEHGDRIFLFGFSRGAYQVRALSAMIHRVGLIHKGNEKQIPFAYELYAGLKISRGKAPPTAVNGGDDSFQSAWEFRTKEFKTSFSRHVKVHFVGVWDTVSSVGVIRAGSLPDTTNGMKHVCYFRHALALDERRVKFLPEYVCGGATNASDVFSDTSDDRPHTKEVWFPGSHGDIGGTAGPSTPPPLTWMALEAAHMGLRLSPFEGELTLNERNAHSTNSLTRGWWLFEYAPFTRLTYKDANGTATTRMFHRGLPRVIRKGQKIHVSVFGNISGDYTPKAVYEGQDKTGTFWTDSLNYPEFVEPWGQVAVYDCVIKLVLQYKAADNTAKSKLLPRLRQFAGTEAGKPALLQAGIFDALKHLPVHKSRVCSEDLLAIREILDHVYKRSAPEKLSYAEVHRLVAFSLENGFRRECNAAHSFILGYTDFHPVCIRVFRKCDCHVIYASFLPDSGRVISAAEDGTIQIRSVKTGSRLLVFRKTERIKAFTCASDGRRAISASYGGAIHIWDVNQGVIIGTFSECSEPISFSPRGTVAASVCNRSGVRVLDAETAKEKPELVSMKGSNSVVSCAVFLPEAEGVPSDGRQLILGFRDSPMSIWDAGRGEMDRERIDTDIRDPACIAISPDGKRVAVALHSTPPSIRVWTWAEGGKWNPGDNKWRLLASIKVDEQIISLAFSPDGRHLVSGGDRRVIRIWDTIKWNKVVSLDGHEGSINAVAVSPDNKRIASCSDDGTVRVWDAEALLTGPRLCVSLSAESQITTPRETPSLRSLSSIQAVRNSSPEHQSDITQLLHSARLNQTAPTRAHVAPLPLFFRNDGRQHQGRLRANKRHNSDFVLLHDEVIEENTRN